MFDSNSPLTESPKLLCLASPKQTQTGLFNPSFVNGLTTCIDPM